MATWPTPFAWLSLPAAASLAQSAAASTIILPVSRERWNASDAVAVLLRLVAVGFQNAQLCYTEKAKQARQHPGPKATFNPAQDNREKQCRSRLLNCIGSTCGRECMSIAVSAQHTPHDGGGG